MRYFIPLLFLFGYSSAFSQHGKKNTVYIEGLGAGGWWSLNYERQVYSKKLYTLQVRGGFGTYRLRDYELKFNPEFIVPAALQFSYGKTHKVEVGLGQTLSSIVQLNTNDMEKQRTVALSTFAGLGYKYQSTKGLLIRVTYVPILEYYKDFRHWAGLSLGYSF